MTALIVYGISCVFIGLPMACFWLIKLEPEEVGTGNIQAPLVFVVTIVAWPAVFLVPNSLRAELARGAKQLLHKAPEYTETSSGFRYRFLNARPEDGYDVAVSKLLPGEHLYRMMEGAHLIAGKPFPVLMDDKVNFEQSVGRKSEKGRQRWEFRLAAGIPVKSLDRTPHIVLKRTG